MPSPEAPPAVFPVTLEAPGGEDVLVELPLTATLADLRAAAAREAAVCPAIVPAEALMFQVVGEGRAEEAGDGDERRLVDDLWFCVDGAQRVRVAAPRKYTARAALAIRGIPTPVGVDVLMNATVVEPDVPLTRVIVDADLFAPAVLTSVLESHFERYSRDGGRERTLGVNADIVEALLLGGADPGARCEQDDDEAGYFAAWEAPTMPLLHRVLEMRRVDLLRVFLGAEGVCVDDRETSGDTTLHRAVKLRWLEGLRLLLAHGAKPNALDHDMTPPLTLAARCPDAAVAAAMLALLVRHGADTAVTARWAAANGRRDVEEALARAAAAAAVGDVL